MRYFLIIFLVFFGCKAFSQKEKTSTYQSSEAPAQPVDKKDQQLSAEKLKDNYMVQRKASYSRSGKYISFTEQRKLDEIVDQLEHSYGAQYEHLFVQMVNANFDDAFKTLFRATVEKKETAEVTPYGIAYAVISNDNELYQKWVRKYHQLIGVTSSEKEYAKNLLTSVMHNGVLFTYGSNDTYPLLVLQEVENYRKDVEVINLEWLQNDAYLAAVNQKLGIDYKGKVIGDEDGLLRSCLTSTKAIYFATSVPPKALQSSSGQLYNTGLAFRLSSSEFQNIKILESNWAAFQKESMYQSDGDNALKANYIFGLLQLYNHYKLTDQKKSSTYLKALKKIGKIANKTAIVERLISD